MSLHIFKKVIVIPNTVDIDIEGRCISVKGVLGTLMYVLHESMVAQINETRNLVIYFKNKNFLNKALIGTANALIRVIIIGVTQGFSKKLQLVGIGYRVSIVNDNVNLMLGLSHPIIYRLPEEVTAICDNQTEIILTSINKQLLGQVAADLRALRPPDPFKGKGIRYIDEVVRNKDTKKR